MKTLLLSIIIYHRKLYEASINDLTKLSVFPNFGTKTSHALKLHWRMMLSAKEKKALLFEYSSGYVWWSCDFNSQRPVPISQVFHLEEKYCPRKALFVAASKKGKNTTVSLLLLCFKYQALLTEHQYII